MDLDLKQTDSIIFDMDGTLWDATDSYAAVWNATLAHFGSPTRIERNDLIPYMGMSLADILDHILSTEAGIDRKAFVADLAETETEMMPKLGGKPYEGMAEGLKKLSEHYRLFMVSNCSRGGLHNFCRFTATTPLFEATISYGENPVPKSENIGLLIERYNLRHAVYVGDTQADCDQAHMAGAAFGFASYGFGTCCNAEVVFASLQQAVDYFLKLKA